ncbi:MAG: transcriptional regulator [bacterium]|nr:transcriptional regulator [bacterium]
MFDTTAEIQAQLRSGEDGLAEFKEVRLGKRSVISPNAEAFAGELVAFANAEGGALLLGVDDDGAVQGLPEADFGTVERWVADVAANGCDPPIRPLIRKARLPDAQGRDVPILVVEVKRSLFVHATAAGRWLVRVGSTKRMLTTQELPRLFQQRGRAFVFDEQPVMTATEDDLDRGALERFFGTPEIPWSELLHKTRVLAKDDDGVDRPTVAALLTFSEDPAGHLLSAKIETGVYRREQLDSEDLVHAQTFTGPVTKQIAEAVSFVDRYMMRPATKTAAGRIDFPQYAIVAVREAVVNAVAHRDYSLYGAKIRLFLFSDRLELYSPGALPNTLTLEDMAYRVFTRNQLLVNFLSRMDSERTGGAYLESRGEGVRRILEESEKLSGRRPEYRLLGEELLLTIWAQTSPHEKSS